MQTEILPFSLSFSLSHNLKRDVIWYAIRDGTERRREINERHQRLSPREKKIASLEEQKEREREELSANPRLFADSPVPFIFYERNTIKARAGPRAERRRELTAMQ